MNSMQQPSVAIIILNIYYFIGFRIYQHNYLFYLTVFWAASFLKLNRLKNRNLSNILAVFLGRNN